MHHLPRLAERRVAYRAIGGRGGVRTRATGVSGLLAETRHRRRRGWEKAAGAEDEGLPHSVTPASALQACVTVPCGAGPRFRAVHC